MLERPGDLIPVQGNATTIPWTKRRSQILNFLHRGPVTFNTLVYDTNVGDISSLATYFNPDRISERELNLRFGHYPAASGGEEHESPQKAGPEDAVKPRLLLYPDHNLNPNQTVLACQEGVEGDGKDEQRPSSLPQTVLACQEGVEGDGKDEQRPSSLPQTVLACQEGVEGDGKDEQRPSSLPLASTGLMGLRLESLDLVSDAMVKGVTEGGEERSEDAVNHLDSSLPVSAGGKQSMLAPKSMTLPTVSLSAALDSLWADKSEGAFEDSVRAEGGLGLGGLVDRMSKSTDVFEMGDKWLGAWDSTHSYSW